MAMLGVAGSRNARLNLKQGSKGVVVWAYACSAVGILRLQASDSSRAHRVCLCITVWAFLAYTSLHEPLPAGSFAALNRHGRGCVYER